MTFEILFQLLQDPKNFGSLSGMDGIVEALLAKQMESLQLSFSSIKKTMYVCFSCLHVWFVGYGRRKNLKQKLKGIMNLSTNCQLIKSCLFISKRFEVWISTRTCLNKRIGEHEVGWAYTLVWLVCLCETHVKHLELQHLLDSYRALFCLLYF